MKSLFLAILLVSAGVVYADALPPALVWSGTTTVSGGSTGALGLRPPIVIVAPTGLMVDAEENAVVDPAKLTESTPYFTVQKALPLLTDKRSIILPGSAAWQMGIPGFGTYSATKAALVSFVRSWTAELASRGIRANVISPGPTETPMVHVGAKTSDEGTSDYFKKMIPMGRLGTADELASAAVFLASDESSFITGIDLPVDGGTASR